MGKQTAQAKEVHNIHGFILDSQPLVPRVSHLSTTHERPWEQGYAGAIFEAYFDQNTLNMLTRVSVTSLGFRLYYSL